MKPKRTDRLNSEYQREISVILSGPVKDREPEMSGLISVTEADVAPDLRTAKIYVSVYAKSPEASLRTFEIIKANAAFIRRELARVMRQRTVPELTFILDGSMEYGSKMDGILAKLHVDDKDEHD